MNWFKGKLWWIVGLFAALMTAWALQNVRAKGKALKRAKDRVQEDTDRQLNEKSARVKKNIKKHNKAQTQADNALATANQKLDALARDDEDTTKMVSDWNADNAAERLQQR